MSVQLREIILAADAVARASGDHGLVADDHNDRTLLHCIELQQAAIEALASRVGSDAGLRAELAEADRAFEELASAARRLLYDISLEDHGMPDSARALANLVFWRDDAPAVETAHAAGEES